VLLVPFVSAYLIWLKRKDLPAAIKSSLPLAAGTVLAGTLLILSSWVLASKGRRPALPDALSISVLSFLCFVYGLIALFWGKERIRALIFPLAFLLFMVPFPTVVTNAVEVFFQHSSANAASLMFAVSQTPVLRDGLFFKLPGIVIEVAQECSGIRSTLVLFITSLVGGYMFFQVKSHRAILALAIVPIAILRNGLRIFTIAMLCVHVDPAMIHSAIHRRGGPLFFAISLIPLFAILVVLYRRERKLRAPRSLITSRSPLKSVHQISLAL
jgi:exosortase C (VPDSG-CTERM-specific)